MKKVFALTLSLCLMAGVVFAEGENEKKSEGYKFEMIKKAEGTTIKNQYRSGTCWSFSGLGFFENELLKAGKGNLDLSEMFVVRNSYSDKAEKYVRFHGNLNFGGGGSFQDVVNCIKKYGIVPEGAYKGLEYGQEKHVHGELDVILKGYVDAVLKNKNRKLTPTWHKGFNGVLDAYMGDYPETFTYEGKEYTPKSFASEVGLNMDDYVMISSYTHHPFYEQFIIEVPDNWSYGTVYNLPLDEMMSVMDNAIEEGYSVAWAADISEKGFSWRKGLAIVPEKRIEDMTDSEKSKWSELSTKDKQKQLYNFGTPGSEKEITQELRQEGFDNYLTTDDHGMVIEGIAKDQNGNKYYYVKNSWSTDGVYDGYFYASHPFVAYKTMSILVNKNSIPKKIKKKMGL